MKSSILGNLQSNDENVTEEELLLITLQLIIAVIFFLSTGVSTILTLDLYLKKHGKKSLFPDITADQIDFYNRVILITLIIAILFINIDYVDVIKKKGEDTLNAWLQVISAIITLLAGCISLYISYKELGSNFEFTDIENIEI